MKGSTSLLALLSLASCAPPEVAVDLTKTEQALWVAEARAKYPRFTDVHQWIVGPTCAPNLGVCHNTSNYPDLHTPGNLIQTLHGFCNLEIPDPLMGWDACERPGDVVYASGFRSEVAWREPLGPGRWRVGLREPPEVTGSREPQIYTHDAELVLSPFSDWAVTIDLVAGETEAEIAVGATDPFVVDFLDGVFRALVGGDPNRNGVYGGTDDDVPKAALIVPGDVERSYLWGRVTGTVPGSRMPLANDPLDNAEYVALACWIESLAGVDDPSSDHDVDYDGCAYARAPRDLAQGS